MIEAMPPIHVELEPTPKTCVVKMVSAQIPSRPEVVLHIEQVGLVKAGAWSTHYCHFEEITRKSSGNVLELRGRGRLDDLPDLPFTLRLRAASDACRVTITGEFTELPADAGLNAVYPCLSSRHFSEQNHPPFEMARKTFFFAQGHGLRWIADTDSRRSEYHEGEDDGGPWIRLFATARFAGQLAAGIRDLPSCWHGNPTREIAAGPLVGWVADNNEYLIALASERAYHVGARWGPCLHSDPCMIIGPGKTTRSFKTVIYMAPADLPKLLVMYHGDFPGEKIPERPVSAQKIWPRQGGILRDGMESDSLRRWKTTKGTLSAYASHGVWINGNLEKIRSPEGITEGQGALLWQVDPGAESTLTRTEPLTAMGAAPVAHVAIDVVNRGPGEVKIEMALARDARTIASQWFPLQYWANRRLLVAAPLNEGRDLNLSLRLRAGEQPASLILDNLRTFHGGASGSTLE